MDTFPRIGVWFVPVIIGEIKPAYDLDRACAREEAPALLVQ
ncbi:hypothetical protein [Methanocella arvoryzae]|nr:hypothetical protein [Methanocella arvoryzae]